MHSRIFQISQNPIEKDNYIDESRYYEGFCGSIADYVGTLTDEERDHEIQWLANSFGESAIIEGNKLTIVDKEAFFKPKYETWLKCLEKLSKVSLTDFASEEYGENSCELLEYQARTAYNDKYAFYMDDNDEYYGNQTLDNFMRNTNDGDVWYLGAVIDYHF